MRSSMLAVSKLKTVEGIDMQKLYQKDILLKGCKVMIENFQ